jgi:cytochrome c-type protein NapB
MKRTVTLGMALAAALLFGCTQQFAGVKSMRGADVASVDNAQEQKTYVGGRPGTGAKVARTFSTQPPVIPHDIEKFGDVNLEENSCMDCHSAANFEKKKAPKIGDSHFIDPRTGKKLADSSMARYNCTQCHVPQVDAPPLVENVFVGNVKN